MSKSLYDILGVKRDASEAELTQAFRKQAKTCHPDLHPGDKKAEERFKRLSGAYEILEDQARRQRYDRGEIDEEGRERAFAGGFRSSGGARPGGGHYDFNSSSNVNFEDILGDLFGGAKRRRSSAGGGSRPTGLGGEDIRQTLEVGFLEAVRGGVRRVQLQDGTSLDVTIPEGSTTGQVLRLKGRGKVGVGGMAGDALIELKVGDHPVFRREGSDIVVDQLVPLMIAITGGKVRVPTLDSEVALTIPPNTSSGRLMRLKGKGIKQPHGGHGDQLVRVMLELPKDAEALLSLRKWAEAQ